MNQKAIVDPTELLRQQIKGMAARTESSGDLPLIRVSQDKHFILPGSEKKVAGPLQVVVYDFINQNQFFTTAYKRGEENRPDCWAQGYNIDEMAPDPELVAEPVNERCSTCPMMEWGSGDNGGRACQNRRKIALRIGSDPKAPIYFISASKTAAGVWDKLMRQLADNDIPLCKITMEMGFNPSRDFPSLVFNPLDENPHFEADAQRLVQARQLLEQVPRPKED